MYLKMVKMINILICVFYHNFFNGKGIHISFIDDIFKKGKIHNTKIKGCSMSKDQTWEESPQADGTRLRKPTRHQNLSSERWKDMSYLSC